MEKIWKYRIAQDQDINDIIVLDEKDSVFTRAPEYSQSMEKTKMNPRCQHFKKFFVNRKDLPVLIISPVVYCFLLSIALIHIAQ